MNKVVFFKDISQLQQAMTHFDMKTFSDQKVPVKLHMGEVKNKYYSKPSYVKHHIDYLHSIHAHPFLYDTTVLYKSPRRYKSGYKKVAKLHKFSTKNVGCDVVIDDTGVPVDINEETYYVGETLHHATHIIALSHVKGHNATGIGGAIKNFGMGGVTKETKQWMHLGSAPIYKKDNCTYCGVCSEICPFHSITVKKQDWKINERSCFGCGVCVENCNYDALDYTRYDLQYVLACAAKACVQNKQVLYINELKRISRNCDCDPFAGPIICPDIGYVVSDDIVSVDHASLDLINQQKEDVFLKQHHVDPQKQITYAEQIGLGTTSYELIKL